ncbi:F-box protein, partial [Trifolium medium]|nr:F-box protein [Trifolium medium]
SDVPKIFRRDENRSDVPKFFQREENSWMNIPTMPMSRWGDICLFKGRPCVADKDGRTLMIGPEDSSIVLLANPVFGGHVKFLVEGECDSLFLVDCHGIDTGADDKDMKFDVFKLDEKEKKWIKLTTLVCMLSFAILMPYILGCVFFT